MCELLGMSANTPTDLRFSFTALSKRGGETGPHRDGWGICFYEGKGVRSFHDPSQCANSELAKFIRNYPIKSEVAIAHVRKANRGAVKLENTHPFTRILWGKIWVFAHNGQLKGVKKLKLNYYKPVGTTDSEYAFCWIMDNLRERFKNRPSATRLNKAIGELMADLRRLGVFNALLSSGDDLYASCSKNLVYITRKAPFGEAVLIDADLRVDFAHETTPNDIVTIVATHPLTMNEEWTRINHDSFVVFKQGLLVA